ncbi:hypothetical protein KORDIASMS9_02523 [Kordia sp. SMS9]|uniref:hypothetical protein n=1 Tax=Kordia sp. SMS9 TaxID=2282170 RepID=UPI000E107ECE|nr:hypothetical protein [Kordia sp. SMS9]AXG70284.1 hypothetical protein KORDIASMS9_02523 [Kordia sp. SMS9]
MKYFLTMLLVSFSIAITAQTKKIPHEEAVKTIDGTLTRMLQLLSVEKGNAIDTKSLKELFLPNVTFSVRASDEKYPNPFETVNLEDFLESLNDNYYKQGYEEKELGKVVNEFNGIANVFQSFIGSDSEGNTEKGINSYQLVYLKDRWWIANMIWTMETDEVKIPKKYFHENSKKKQ